MPSARSNPRSQPQLWRGDVGPRAGAASVAALALLLLAAAPPLAAQQRQHLAATHTAVVVKFTPGEPVDLVAVPAALRQPLTLRLRDVTVEQALQEVMARANISLTYSRAVVPLDRIVSVSVENESVVEALRQVLGDSGVELWVSAEGRMALVPAQREARRTRQVQTGTIAGRVTDAASSEPLVGVTVRLADAPAGAITASDGRYTIRSVSPGTHLLRAQRIGFAPDSQTVTVADGQTTTADFALHVRAVQLSEVVSIGYGTTSRRDVSAAISSVSSEEIRQQPTVSVDQALQGRAPGVQVVTSSGQPGASAMVRIRGGNSITAGNDPLYVIDGVPMVSSPNGANTSTLEVQGASGISPLAALNPNDIESIDVLKDASAAAIYGARAANGVVLITTKRGRTGQPQINFGTYYGTATVRHKLSLLDAKQFAEVANAARTNAGQAAIYSDAQIAAMGAGTNWQDAIFRTAPTQNYDLSIAGGQNDTRYYLSGNLLKQDGVVIGTDLTRGSLRLNFDQNIGKRLRVGNRLTFTREQGKVMPNGGGGEDVSSVLLNALTAPPTLPIRGSGGEYFIGLNPASGRPFANPVASALLVTNLERQNRFVGNVFGEYDVIPGLTFRSSFGGDYLSSMQDFYSPSTTYPGITYGGQGSRGSLQTTTWLNENTLDYKRSALAFLTNVDLLAGLSLQRTNGENISGTSQGFVTDALAQNGLITGTSYLGVWSGAPHSSLLSYLTRARWDITDRYLFSVAGRWDGSSKFGEGNQYGFFPSASFAWRLSNEGPIKRLGVFDDLKLRTSFGRSGNQDIGDYRALATLGSSSYVFNGTRVTGYSPSTLANPNLKWETTNEADVGLDLAVLRNRLAVTADFYNKHTKDLLYEVSVPATLGYSSQLQNIGGVGNKGFELGVNTVNLTGRLGWTTGLNLAWNRNKVLNIGPDSQAINPVGVGAGAVQNPTILKVGQPINSFYGYVYDKIGPDGQVMYKDLNNDGDITTDDQTIIGNAQPNYTGGLTNRFTFGNFGVTAFLQFSVGGKIYNINRAMLTSTSGRRNQLTDVLPALNGAAKGISVPKLGNTFDSRPSDLFVEDGTYLRGKNLRVDYTIPSVWLGRAGIRNVTNAQIYVSMQNFFTKTNYTGFDPEVTEYATSVIAQGIDFGTYPQTRQITFGLNAGF